MVYFPELREFFSLRSWKFRFMANLNEKLYFRLVLMALIVAFQMMSKHLPVTQTEDLQLPGSLQLVLPVRNPGVGPEKSR